MQLALLWSDWLMWTLAIIAVITVIIQRRQPSFRAACHYILRRKVAMVALVILLFYSAIGLIDSIHLKVTHLHSGAQIESLLDIALPSLASQPETSYSAPFSRHLYTKSVMTLPNGQQRQDYPALKHVSPQDDILLRGMMGIFIGLMTSAIVTLLMLFCLSRYHQQNLMTEYRTILSGKTEIAWREGILTMMVIFLMISTLLTLSSGYHVFGTDKIGQDVFYQAIKSVRTGLVIGTLTTVFMLPFALVLGTMAGYFGGWIDDIIQYIYTTMSSIPGVLLISASILVLQVFISNHARLFPTLLQRADARLLALCFILGVTGWAGLCRLLRGETLKLRELDYVAAAKSMGVKPWKILARHILPNVFHIIIITVVLDFSMLVLAEAVLSYVGVGVDPTTISWGNMINSSRLELAREPIVWWPLAASLVMMFVLVLSANLLSDIVRDAFDPRIKQSAKQQ